MKYLRRCIRISAKDSPNVAFALWEIAQGRTPSNKTIVPGMLSWQEYEHRRRTYPAQLQVESLDADWYEGPEERLVTDEWLDFAAAHAEVLKAQGARRSGRRWLGIDPGEGGDDSAWVVIDRQGVLAVVSMKTPDTNKVFGRTCLMVREHGVAWGDVVFDLGGGGKEHVDRLRASGFQVRGLRFGAIKKELKRGMTLFGEKREVEEDTASYESRRSEMAWGLRMLLERPAPHDDPVVLDAVNRTLPAAVKRAGDKPGFALPMPMCEELRRQIAAVPLDWDAQSRFKLIPKNPRRGPDGRPNPDDPNCFRNRIGRSPDQFDAFCLAVWAMNNEPTRTQAGTS